MKKLITMLWCLLTVLALAGCGGQEGNELAALFEEGYEVTSTSFYETSWTAILQKAGGWDSVYLANAAMTEQQSEDYMNINLEDEDYEAKLAKEKAFLGQLADVTVTDITDRVPSQETLDAFIGRTVGDLEAEGYGRSGYADDGKAGYVYLFFDGPEYCLDVTPAEAVDSLDNYSENDLRGLTIAGVRFSGFSSQFLREAAG